MKNQKSTITRPITAINESTRIFVAAFNEAITPGQDGWIRIAPFGEFPNSAGLQVFDRESSQAIVAAFNSTIEKAAEGWRGLPIYEGHPDDPSWAKANPGVKRSAYGRVKEVQTRADGLYGKVAFNEAGQALVRGDAPAYTAQSPHWGMRPIAGRKNVFRPSVLFSLGLTNNPNIPGTELPALNEQPNPAMNKHIIALLAALGRPVANADTVSDDQLTAAVNEATTAAPALVAASTALAESKTQLTTATNEVAVLKQQLSGAGSATQTAANEAAALRGEVARERAARAEVAVTTAVNEGRITAAQRPEWVTKFTAANADFAAVAGELNRLKRAVNTAANGQVAGRRETEINSKNRITAINEAVAKHMKETGAGHHVAYHTVREKQPELFKS